MSYHDQYHDDDLDIASLVNISPLRKMHSSKFNTDVHDYAITFNDNLPDRHDLVELFALLYETFTYLFEQLLKDFSQADFVRIVIISPMLITPISIPYLPVSKISVDMIFDAVANVLNSNQSLDLARGLRIHVTRTVLPGGAGCKSRFSEISLGEWMKSKKSIVQLKNTDNLCLARAIIIAMESKEPRLVSKKHFTRFVIQDGPTSKQTIATLQLHRKAGIPPNKPSYDLSDAAIFHQTIMPQYAIHVYDKSLECIFDGKFDVTNPPKHHLYLLLTDSHYDVVKSMPSLLGKYHFCDYCQKGFRTLIHPCEATKCMLCNNIKCTNTQHPTKFTKVDCSTCGKVFHSVHCKEFHHCKQREKCTQCGQFYSTQPYQKRKHALGCGKYRCRVCDTYFELPKEDHFCFVQRIGDSQKESDSSVEIEDEHEDDDVTSEPDPDVGSEPKPRKKDDDLLFWYDFETMFVDQGFHVPNLLVCVTKQDTHIFKVYFPSLFSILFLTMLIKGKDLLADFFKMISSYRRKTNGRLIFMAHNASGFDAMLILRGIYDEGLAPKIFYRGSKILMLELSKSVRFICTYQFLPFSLRSLAKNFGLQFQKLYFPYLLNREEFLGKEIQFPEERFFNPDSLRPPEYKEFKAAYDKMKNEYMSTGKLYNVSEELEKYCIADTLVLRDACEAFSTEFEAMTGLKPFSTGITLPSVCLTLYRGQHLPTSNMLPVFPQEGIATKTRHSKICCLWLQWESKLNGNIYIRGAHNTGEEWITQYLVDGFHRTSDDQNNTIYEFYGCAYHSCSRHYPDPNGINQLTKLTHGKMRQQLNIKRKALRETGYRLVEMWECDFRLEVAANEELSKLAHAMGLIRMNRLVPRDALYGGRVEVFNLYAERSADVTMDYYDFVSLYPTVMETGQYSIGRPIILYGFELPPAPYINFTEYRGLLYVKVLPPSNIMIGVLPLRTKNHGLVFPLCAACAEECSRVCCTHTTDERMLIGVWSHIEVNVAITEGYQIVEVYEIYHFENQSDDVFRSYIRTFMAAKIANSGFPHDILTEPDKENFIQQLNAQTGMQLAASDFSQNPVRKQIAKLCLNSLWGKFSQKTNHKTTKIMRKPAEFYSMHTNPSVVIDDIFHINEDLLHVTYSDLEDTRTRGNTCLMVAIETTAMARMKLYKTLKEIGGDRLIYCDTDSVIFKSNATDCKPPTGNLFGQLQDEVAGKYGGGYINRFVSLGCKTYGMEIINDMNERSYELRCKGISLNIRTAKNINFESMVNLLKTNIGGDLVMEEPYFIQRSKREARLLSIYRSKILRYTFRKRLVDFETFKTVPLGYRADD